MKAPPSHRWGYRWIKTECGRAKYVELSQRSDPLATIRLAWFVVIAAIRDSLIQS